MQSLLSFIISRMEQCEALYIRLTCFDMLLDDLGYSEDVVCEDVVRF